MGRALGASLGTAFDRLRNRQDRASVPARAALPQYQRGYSGDPYPRDDQQPTFRKQNYKYPPRDACAQQQHNQPPLPAAAQWRRPQNRASAGRPEGRFYRSQVRAN